jgi:hypothetical protein
MERKRQRKADRERIDKQQANGFCGAARRSGGFCQAKAGQGTSHPGSGFCRLHGGTTPSGKLKGVKAEAVFMGAPKSINAVDAIIWVIHITAGEIEWFSERMKELDKGEWYEHSVIGKQMHVLQRERANAMVRLERFSKDALSLGLMERRIRMAEMYGSALGRYTKGILDDLKLTPEQEKRAPAIVRRHLSLLEGGQPKLELPEIEISAVAS